VATAVTGADDHHALRVALGEGAPERRERERHAHHDGKEDPRPDTDLGLGEVKLAKIEGQVGVDVAVRQPLKHHRREKEGVGRLPVRHGPAAVVAGFA